MKGIRLVISFVSVGLLASCYSTPERWEYRYVQGRTASLVNGKAVAPSGAPRKVRVAIDAANRLVGKPYR